MKVPFKKLLLQGELPLWLDTLFIVFTFLVLIVRFADLLPDDISNILLLVVSLVANIPVAIATIRAAKARGLQET